MSQSGLSQISTAVLEMIAAGSTYEQILSVHPDFTYLDIFDAAREALDLSTNPRRQDRPAPELSEIRDRYPRAYEPWSEADDKLLVQYIRAGLSVAQIAGRLQRQRGAIRSRITKNNLIGDLSPKEQDRLRRISLLDSKEEKDRG